MKNLFLGISIFCGLGYSQLVVTKLYGKHIYIQRQDAGHQDGYNGFVQLMQANASTYGYIVEYAASPLNQTALDAVCARLYQPGVAHASNTIDVLIFCQGEGDRNVAGSSPYVNAALHMTQVNAHVRAGGGLIIVHAGGGREVSWQGWLYGAKLMTDWFMDAYFGTAAIPSDAGHFPALTLGTLTMDTSTSASKDSSTYFIRKVMTLPTAQKGYGQPLVNANAQGEWYHFNGGKKYEDGTGGNVTQASNRWQPKPLRGDPGYPDSGIGPLKVLVVLTHISTNYTPPGGLGRPTVWGREVSAGVFDSTAHGQNGRFLYFNPGHQTSDYTVAGNYLTSLFLSTLRWVVKDERGCTNPAGSNYNALSTVDDGSCQGVAILDRNITLEDRKSAIVGNISVDRSGIVVSMGREGPHVLQIFKINGEAVFQRKGTGIKEYRKALESGLYLVKVEMEGQSYKKRVSIMR